MHLPLKRSLISGKTRKQVMIVKAGASINTSFDRQFSCSPRLKVLTRRRKGHTHIIVGAQKVCTYDKDDKKKFNTWLLVKKNPALIVCRSCSNTRAFWWLGRLVCMRIARTQPSGRDRFRVGSSHFVVECKLSSLKNGHGWSECHRIISLC